MKKLYSQGDTIVEVLIAIMIVSTVIAASYVTVSRVTNNARQAQERGVATKLLEAQAERIQAVAAESTTTANDVFGAIQRFCLNSGSNFTPLGTTPLPTLASDTFTSYPGCNFDQSNNAYTATSPGLPYYISVERAINTFTITIRWAKAGGNGNEQATLSYRVYRL